MAACGNCGRPITFLKVDGVKLAFDVRDAIRGEGRYVDVGGTLKPVSPNADVYAMQLHSQTCGKAYV